MRICSKCGERNPDRARFCMECAEPLDSVSYRQDERKVVSIIFADLEGSTAMEERLDPEIVRALLTRFYLLSREILERHGGTVEKFIGDAVEGVFGVPHAHEDDALRAARSAVELLDTIERTNEELLDRYGVGLRLRIGINTGEVVAGDPTKESSFVSGDPINVAARLEQSAPAGGVLIGEDTYLAVMDFVRAEPVGPLTLKGKSEPVPAFRLLEVLDYWEKRPIGSPLVGRNGEIASLQQALRRVEDFRAPAMVLVLGEPGIGKSRLIDDFLRMVEDAAKVVATSCADDGDMSWRPILAEFGRQLLGVSVETGVEDVKPSIARILGARERTPLVTREAASLMGLGQANSFEAASWALRELLKAVSAQRGVILSIDDLQWAGPELLEFLRSLLDGLLGRVLVVGSAPPEFMTELDNAAAWILERADRVDMLPLDRSDVVLMAEYLLGASVDEQVENVIVDACGGNPLFLVETIRMFRDQGALRQGDAGRNPVIGVGKVPSSIRSLIAARLDLLGDVDREVLCVAAVIGLVVDVEDLRAISRLETLDDLDTRLQRLIDRQLLHEQSPGTLRFPHGLVRTVAYETLTKEARSELHAACALHRESEGDLAGAASHLEHAYELRRDLGLNDGEARRLALRAVVDLAAAGLSAIEHLDRRAAVTFEQRAYTLSSEVEGEAPREISELAFRLGAWDDVAALLDHGGDEELRPIDAHRLGVAIVKRVDREHGVGDIARGRRLLEQAGKAGDTDALAALAGTWRGIDDDRARDLYGAVVKIDPSEPYALGNLLEYEIERTHGLSVVEEFRSSIGDAIERRKAQTALGQDVPWSWFDLGKFQLLLGAADEAYQSFAAGVLTSTAPYMPSSALGSIERLARWVPQLPGSGELQALLRLSTVAVFGADPRSIDDLATPNGSPLIPPVLIIAGASTVSSSFVVSRLRGPLLAALRGVELTLVSGETTGGVKELVRDIADAMPAIRTIGYAPKSIHDHAEEDVPDSELRTIDNLTFGTRELLRYWADILTSDVDLRDVRMLAVGGGELSGIEYRTALAFGAQVAVLKGSGGEAAALMRDTAWPHTERLGEMSTAEDDVRSFLAHRDGGGPWIA
jgi:class 3 adenylate cyclase